MVGEGPPADEELLFLGARMDSFLIDFYDKLFRRAQERSGLPRVLVDNYLAYALTAGVYVFSTWSGDFSSDFISVAIVSVIMVQIWFNVKEYSEDAERGHEETIMTKYTARAVYARTSSFLRSVRMFVVGFDVSFTAMVITLYCQGDYDLTECAASAAYAAMLMTTAYSSTLVSYPPARRQEKLVLSEVSGVV